MATAASASGSAAGAEFNKPSNVKSHPDDTRTELITQHHEYLHQILGDDDLTIDFDYLVSLSEYDTYTS